MAAGIPKATEGYRTVGLFPAFYRLMVKVTSPEVKDWELENPRTFFSFASGRSAVLTVWEQAATQELTSAIGKPSSGQALWDLSDFDEGVNRIKLYRRAAAQDFPLHMA